MILLDKFKISSPEIIEAMLDLSDLMPGEKHIDLGSGNGVIVKAAIDRGAISIGCEADKSLAEESARSLKIEVLNADCFDVDFSEYDVITSWFTKMPEAGFLFDKLFNEMKSGARLVNRGLVDHFWKPISRRCKYQQEIFQGQKVFRVNGEILCLYVR